MLPAPWETSFNDGFCSFKVDGFCYGDPESDNRIVREPTHSPPFAAAFEIGIGDAGGQQQSRCVREGALPEEAYYGAWFYLPTKATDATDNWNLFHFQGAPLGERLKGLWDVSLAEGSDAGLVAVVYDRFNASTKPAVYRSTEPIPLGRWFQLEFLFKRASDATGAVALFQDGAEVIRVEQIPTDDTPFGQWYVGNWAAALSPSNYTLYVDDVTVRLSN
jgi:hypothetical protein